MVSLLHPCSYVAAVVAFLFVTLSLASGLLYIAELVEEHSRIAKLTGQRAIYTVILLHILFCIFDSLPIHLVAFGILCHLVYLQNFSKTWPFISLSSIKFIASCLLVILDHFAWFFYFADRAKEGSSSGSARHPRQPGYRPGNNHWDARYGGANSKYAGLRELSFMDVATFFGVCVWLVPFFLFLSLSANDNVLPSLGEQTPQIKTTSASDAGSPSMGTSGGPGFPLHIQLPPIPRERSSILKVALDPLLSLIPRIGGSRYRSSRSQRDGLIASPMNSAPPSPALFGGPPSPSMYSHNMGPFSPSLNGAYDSNSLSPQTSFTPRFGGQEGGPSLRKPISTPQLRQPPGPKRSATSPPGDMSFGNQTRFPAGNPYAQPVVPTLPPLSSVQQQQQHSYGQASPPKAGALRPSSAMSNREGDIQEEALRYGAEVIPRSTSPFPPPGGAGGTGTSGLVSRKKNA